MRLLEQFADLLVLSWCIKCLNQIVSTTQQTITMRTQRVISIARMIPTLIPTTTATIKAALLQAVSH